MTVDPLVGQCPAKSKQTGERCKRRQRGGGVCYWHSGNVCAVAAKRGRTDDQQRQRRPVVDELFLDKLMARVQAEGLDLTGRWAAQPTDSSGAGTGAREEMADHLEYEGGDPAGMGLGNSRNGFTAKTVTTEIGPVPALASMSGTLPAMGEPAWWTSTTSRT